MFQNTLLLIFPAAMIFAAIMDLFTMTIPNRISIALVAGFVIIIPFAGLSLEAVAMHVATGLAMLAFTILLFWRGWLGGGDAKLLSSAALWVGYDLFFPFMLYTCLLGGVLSIAILAYRWFIPDLWVVKAKQAWASRLHESGGQIPYGIAIAAAAILIYPKTDWFISLTSVAM